MTEKTGKLLTYVKLFVGFYDAGGNPVGGFPWNDGAGNAGGFGRGRRRGKPLRYHAGGYVSLDRRAGGRAEGWAH